MRRQRSLDCLPGSLAFLKKIAQISSVSEIEFWAPYVVDGRSLFACILRFEDAKTDYSDTLSGRPASSQPRRPSVYRFRYGQSSMRGSECVQTRPRRP
jgi:hypothetical protein